VELITAKEDKYLISFTTVAEKQVWAKEVKDAIQRLRPKGVFGVPLLELLVAEKSRKLGIPYVVWATTNHLLAHGLFVEDLFTQSASAISVEEMRNAFESISKDVGEISLMDKTPHSVANLLKLYFRELPEPLFTWEMYDDMLKIADSDDPPVRPHPLLTA
jgi:hypothetical protein